MKATIGLKHIFALLFVLSTVPAFAAYRPIDIEREIEHASFVGEITFIGYDSVLVSKYSEAYYAFETDSITGKEVRVGTMDSVWIITRVFYKINGREGDAIDSADVRQQFSWVSYHSLPDSLPRMRVSNGFWPRTNDTTLLVLDSTGQVSIFALLDGNQYIFWDPYPNSGMNSVFAFDDHFKNYPDYGRNSSNHVAMKHTADFLHKQHASQYHCAIRKSIFWKDVVEADQP